MSNPRPTRPAEFVAALELLTDDRLPMAVYAERRRRGLSLRRAAAEIGVKYSTVLRVELGDYLAENMKLATVARFVRWLEESKA